MFLLPLTTPIWAARYGGRVRQRGAAAGCAGGRGTRRNVNCGVSVVNYAGFGAEYAVSVCVNGLQWVSSTPNFRTLRAEVAAKVTLTHEKEGSDGTRRHY